MTRMGACTCIMPSDAEKMAPCASSAQSAAYRLSNSFIMGDLHQVICTFDLEDVMGLLEFLEQTALSTFIRESSSLLAFPTFLCMHTLGLSLVVGVNSVVAIRVLGVASSIPLQPLKRLYPFIWAGLILSLISGIALAMAKATTLMLNPILLVKLVMITCAVPIMWLLEKKVFRTPGFKETEAGNTKIMAAALLVLWTAVMIAGRLIGYSGTIFGL